MTRTARVGPARLPHPVGMLAVCLMLALALLDPRHAARAQSPDEAVLPRVQLTLSHLTGVLGPGSVPAGDDTDALPASHLELRVLVKHDGPGSLDALRLAVEIHPAVDAAVDLHAAFIGSLTTQPVHVHTPEIAEGRAVLPGEVVGVATAFAADEVDWAGGAGGVHPIRVAVVRGTEVLVETVTAAIWLAAPPELPLLTTLVWPIDDAPWRTTGGAYPAEVDRDLRGGGRLDVLIAALERRPTAPVVLAPAAHLLEDLSDRADGYVRLERQDDGALESREVTAEDAGALTAAAVLGRLRRLADDLPLAPVSSSYADADLAALLAGGPVLRDLGATAAVDGRRRLGLALGADADATTHLVGDRIDRGVLDVLPGDALLIPARITDLADLDRVTPVPEPIRRLRTPSGRLVTGLVADPYVEEALNRIRHPAGGVAAAQRVLAHTAIRYLAAPATAGRALVVLPPRTFSPGPQAAEELLAGLTRAPWLRLGPPSKLARDGRTSSADLQFVASSDPLLAATFGTALTTAHTDLAAAVAASPEGTTRLQERPVTDLQDALLRATSRWHRGAGASAAEALVRDVQQVVDATFGDITVASSSVTLTSDTGQIPITLQRTRGGPVRVRVVVESQGRLEWPEGRTTDEVLLAEGGSQTVTFPTRALSTGTFPVTVRVTDPTGVREFVRASLSVRSTAISRPALGGIGAVILVLLLAGGLRRRRPDPLRLVAQE